MKLSFGRLAPPRFCFFGLRRLRFCFFGLRRLRFCFYFFADNISLTIRT